MHENSQVRTLFNRTSSRLISSQLIKNYLHYVHTVNMTFLIWLLLFLYAYYVNNNEVMAIVTVSLQGKIDIHWPNGCYYIHLKFIQSFSLKHFIRKISFSSREAVKTLPSIYKSFIRNLLFETVWNVKILITSLVFFTWWYTYACIFFSLKQCRFL